jgi:hypothetical protein
VFLLIRLDCVTMAQITFGIAPELVEEEVHAVRLFLTLVAMPRHAPATVQTGTLRDALHSHIHFAVGIASRVAEDEFVRHGKVRLGKRCDGLPFGNLNRGRASSRELLLGRLHK